MHTLPIDGWLSNDVIHPATRIVSSSHCATVIAWYDVPLFTQMEMPTHISICISKLRIACSSYRPGPTVTFNLYARHCWTSKYRLQDCPKTMSVFMPEFPLAQVWLIVFLAYLMGLRSVWESTVSEVPCVCQPLKFAISRLYVVGDDVYNPAKTSRSNGRVAKADRVAQLPILSNGSYAAFSLSLLHYISRAFFRSVFNNLARHSYIVSPDHLHRNPLTRSLWRALSPMSNYSGSTLYVIVVCGTICFVTLLQWRRRRAYARTLPPGPPRLPIVGNLFQITTTASSLWETASEWGKTYGDHRIQFVHSISL